MCRVRAVGIGTPGFDSGWAHWGVSVPCLLGGWGRGRSVSLSWTDVGPEGMRSGARGLGQSVTLWLVYPWNKALMGPLPCLWTGWGASLFLMLARSLSGLHLLELLPWLNEVA